MAILFKDGKIVFDDSVIVFTDDPELCECCGSPACDCTNECVTFDDGSETGVATITDTPCETGYWVHVEGGLEVWGNGLTFYDGRWEIANLRGDSAGWEGYYLGPSTPCPDGTYTLETTLSGTPPATVTVTSGPCPCECNCATWAITLISADGTARYDTMFTDPCSNGYFNLINQTGSDPPYLVGATTALTWNAVDCHWEMTVEPSSDAWKGVYHGPSTPCPMGTFTLHSTLFGSPPATLDVTT